jgi:hypothetical protein
LKSISTITHIAIVAFWIAMNGTLAWRLTSVEESGTSLRSTNEFLGTELRRERWLEIFRTRDGKRKKVGYSGFALEKLYGKSELEHRSTVDLVLEGFLPKVGILPEGITDTSRLVLTGEIIFDEQMRAKSVRFYFSLRLLEVSSARLEQSFSLIGEADEKRESLTLSLRRGEELLVSVRVPSSDLVPADGLGPAFATGDLEPGRRFEVAVVDPFSVVGLGDSTARVEVVEERTEVIDGRPVDFFVLETEWRSSRSRSWVTKDGEVLRQEIPSWDLTLEHAGSREAAQRGIRP